MVYSAKWRRRDSGIVLFKASPASLPSGSTFTRSTTATYVDQNGVYQTAPINTLRNGHYVGMAPRTNYALNSRGVGGTNWSNNGSAIGVALNASVSPDGSMTASHLTQTAVNGSSRFLNSATVPLAAGSPVVVSFWIRLVSGTPINNIVLATLETGGTQGTGTNIAPSITASWQRFSFVRTLSAGTTSFTGAISFVGWATTGTASDAVYAVSECQIESGTAATADIPTTTAAVTVVDGGVPTILLEGSRTNSVLWSRDLTNAAWPKANAGTGTATQNAVGLDGTANSATTLTDTDATIATGWSQVVTVPNDGNTHAVSFYIKKDTDQTRFVGCQLFLSVGTTSINRITHLNTQTGAITAEAAPGGSTQRVVDAGLWWVVELTVTNNTTGNTSLQAIVYPARATVAGSGSVSATGSCVVGQVQVELNSAFYSSPIFTTTVAVTRGADSDQAGNVTAPPAVQTFYTKHIELGTVKTLNSRVWEIASTDVAPRLLVYAPAGGTYTAFLNSATGSVTAPIGVAPALGDTAELRLVLFADGSIQLFQSINGAAETASTQSAPVAGGMPGAWSGTAFFLGEAMVGSAQGFAAFQSVKIAAGVQSLATMRTL